MAADDGAAHTAAAAAAAKQRGVRATRGNGGAALTAAVEVAAHGASAVEQIHTSPQGQRRSHGGTENVTAVVAKQRRCEARGEDNSAALAAQASEQARQLRIRARRGNGGAAHAAADNGAARAVSAMDQLRTPPRGQCRCHDSAAYVASPAAEQRHSEAGGEDNSTVPAAPASEQRRSEARRGDIGVAQLHSETISEDNVAAPAAAAAHVAAVDGTAHAWAAAAAAKQCRHRAGRGNGGVSHAAADDGVAQGASGSSTRPL